MSTPPLIVKIRANEREPWSARRAPLHGRAAGHLKPSKGNFGEKKSKLLVKNGRADVLSGGSKGPERLGRCR